MLPLPLLAALPALALVTVSAQSGCQYVEHVDQAGRTRRLRVAENRTPNTRDCVDGIVLIDEADNKGMFINFWTLYYWIDVHIPPLPVII